MNDLAAFIFWTNNFSVEDDRDFGTGHFQGPRQQFRRNYD